MDTNDFESITDEEFNTQINQELLKIKKDEKAQMLKN